MFQKSKKSFWAFISAGVIISAITLIAYATQGYSWWVFFGWVVAAVVAGIGFWQNRNDESGYTYAFSKRDLVMVAVLVAMLAPLYLTYNYSIQLQVNTDESTIMWYTYDMLKESPPNIFGISDYFQYPTFIFMVFGSLGKLMGGIDLFHMRVVHASFGLVVAALAYGWFRVIGHRFRGKESGGISSEIFAFGAAAILSVNHALIGVSRMATRDNSALLVLLPALTLLFMGLKKRSVWYSYIGGVVAGFSVYNYLPGRITIFFWLMLIGWLLLLFRKKYSFKTLAQLTVSALLGFMLIVAPLVVTVVQEPRTEAADIYKKTLFSEKSRNLQQWWVQAPSVEAGIKTNIKQGLTAFNSRVYDNNNVYVNYGYGFLDPLTGILLWLGLITLIVRYKKKEESFLVITSFLVFWLTITFIFNKNPHYNRLFTTLPFVAFFAAHALKFFAETVGGKLRSYIPPHINMRIATGIFSVGVLSIVIWNGFMYHNFVQLGFNRGDIMGNSARHIVERRDIPGHVFYLADNESIHSFFYWGTPHFWKQWLGIHTGDDQYIGVVSTNRFYEDISTTGSFTLFIHSNLWKPKQQFFDERFPNYTINYIMPNNTIMAIDVTQ